MKSKKIKYRRYIIIALVSCIINLIYHTIYYTNIGAIENVSMITNISILFIYLAYAVYLWIYYKKNKLDITYLLTIAIIDLVLIVSMSPFVIINGIKEQSIAILSNVNTVTLIMYLCIKFREHQLIRFKR